MSPNDDIIYEYPPVYDEYKDEEWYSWMTDSGVTCDPTRGDLKTIKVSPAKVIFESQGPSNEAQKAHKYLLIGSVASRMTPATGFMDSFEARNFIQLKGYFKGSSNTWDCAFNGVLHQDIPLCALVGLTNHLSMLKLDDALRNGNVLPYEVYRRCLGMDGQTIANLEIFINNNVDGENMCGTLGFKFFTRLPSMHESCEIELKLYGGPRKVTDKQNCVWLNKILNIPFNPA